MFCEMCAKVEDKISISIKSPTKISSIDMG